MSLRQFTNGLTEWWAFSGNESDIMQLMGLAGDHSSIDLFDVLCESDIATFVDPFVELTGDEPYYTFGVQIYPFISKATVAACLVLNESERPRIDIDWEQLNETPEAVKFQLTEKQWGCNGSQRAYEIGRFITSKTEVGIIKSIQTELTFADNNLRWPRGDSTWFEREFDPGPPQVGEVFAAWALKIEKLPGEGLDPNNFRIQVVVTPANWFHEIPGTVHPEMTPWNRMLFPWGNDNYTRFRCPSGSLVSLWCYLFQDGGEGGLDRIGGMMKGHTQIMESDRTYENMTRVY